MKPLVPTHWHQSYPYNIFAPNRSDNGAKTMTGCVATAGAQIAYYFRRDCPTELPYDTPTYSGSWFNAPVTFSLPKGTPLRWDLMRLSGSGTAKQDTAVAVLMYAMGTYSHLGYGSGDGTATAGQTSDMGITLANDFLLDNDCLYKSGTSQSSWETTIYNNLSSGRPLFYSGANESAGGHAVVLDGYEANTGLYHFNFGWGGQGDGYYTVDDATGMNGFNTYQTILANITPSKPNLSATLSATNVYYRSTATVRAVVRNNSTLDYKGFYAFSSAKGEITGAAKQQDLTTTTAASFLQRWCRRPANSCPSRSRRPAPPAGPWVSPRRCASGCSLRHLG